jgi:TorA maturation chaperone TorD
MNEFSILCRVLGSLYYRQPQDPLLVPLFTLIREGKLAQNWPLEQDELLERLQKSCDMQQISTDYNALFVGEECRVSPTVLPGRKGRPKRKCGHSSLSAVCR